MIPLVTASTPRQAVEMWKTDIGRTTLNRKSAGTGFPQSHSLDDEEDLFKKSGKRCLTLYRDDIV